MTVAVLQVRFRLHAHTLKEKRSVVKSVVERLRNRFNVSVAEVADLNTPEFATIAVACISNESDHADRQVQEIAGVIEAWRLDVELLDVETELIQV